MRILIVGAGATGGYFGGRLAQAGRDVTFLVRPRRAEQLRQTGLKLKSPHGDAEITPTLLVTGAPTRAFDAVILGVKAYALKPALDDLAPAIDPETMIMPLLNGMAHVDQLVARFGEQPVLGGVCRVATTLDAEGGIVQLAPFQDLGYGERDGSTSERVQQLDGALSGAGFRTELTTNILQQMWDKWLLLAAGGALTCLLRGNVGEIEAAGGVETALGILGEVRAVTTASGFAPSAPVRSNAERVLTTAGSSFATSMYRDMTARQSVEADHIIGDLIERGAALGQATPLLRAAFAALRVYQGRLP